MNGRTNQSKTQSSNELSEEHLCYIVSQGFNISDEESYLELIVEPRFRCEHCGRQAADNRNLCVPMVL